MKRFAFILAAVLAIAGCGIRNSRTEMVENEDNKSGQLCGGYTEGREPSDEEYQLFREVTDTLQGMTLTPLSVQTQVVAGINYKFYCRCSDSNAESNPSHCWLTIYKPLPGQGEPKVTSIEKVD